MPCVGGDDAGRGYGGLVGAHQRGSLEVEEKLIDGTEGVEACRRRSASGAQPLCRWRRACAQAAARVATVRGVATGTRGDKERLLGWAVSQRWIRIRSRTQYSKN